MKIKYWFVNGDRDEVEVDKKTEWGKFILESQKNESSRNKYHQRHTYSLEANTYEGQEYSYNDTYFEEAANAEEKARIKQMLLELTKVQRRRCVWLWNGKSIEEIAHREGRSVQSVHESILAARKKLEKYRREYLINCRKKSV